MRIFFQESATNIFLSNKNKFTFNSSNRWFFDKSALTKQIEKWEKNLFWIKPYYAIKSNSSEQIIATISNTDTFLNNQIGFDAASLDEINLALKYTKPNNIIYTNPHIIPHEKEKISKLLSQISVKVVDNLCEVKKIIEYKIKTDILIRLISNIQLADVKFDTKFGCTIEQAYEIIEYAKKHNLKIRGVSFHIGSGGNFSRKECYKKVIDYSTPLLDHIQELLQDEKPILDIGGGLLYDTDLKEALEWTKELPYTLISELGRYYSDPVYHLAVQIISSTERGIYLDNGIYHELNVYHRDHWKFPKLTHYYDSDTDCIQEITKYKTINIFGPTCDSYDTINECIFPENFEIGDWIFMNNMGAYTSAGSTDFNGIRSACNSGVITL